MVKTGLDRILNCEYRNLLDGKRVGLIVNPASVSATYQHAADLFFECKDFFLTTLFGPQHGIRGETQDNMIEWQTFTDPATGLPAYSLYGDTRQPTSEMLSNLDVLVFDVPDVGTRIYTFIWTMALAMQACARDGKSFVVLDRPNPIGGAQVEGNVLEPEFASFVGLFPIPMRHGMTVAELALMLNSHFGISCDLRVVPMEGWKREMYYGETGQPWVMPSPNMPTLDTAVVYPGAVLFEGMNLSEGRGTTRPFELVGAPWIDARKLAADLNSAGLDGVIFRPAHFQPTFHKHCGEICGGVQYHVMDVTKFKPYIAALWLLYYARLQNVKKFAWKEPPYEYVYDKLPIDVMFGTDKLRVTLENGATPDELEKSWFSGLEEFVRVRSKFLLY